MECFNFSITCFAHYFSCIVVLFSGYREIVLPYTTPFIISVSILNNSFYTIVVYLVDFIWIELSFQRHIEMKLNHKRSLSYKKPQKRIKLKYMIVHQMLHASISQP